MQSVTGFTGRQLMSLVVALLLVTVLAPAGASAIGQLVSLVGEKDIPAEVNEDEQRLLVDALPGVSEAWHLQAHSYATRRNLFRTQFAYSDQVAITSITVINASSYRRAVGVYSVTSPDTCGHFDQITDELTFLLPGDSTFHATYPQPFVISTPTPEETAPWTLCLTGPAEAWTVGYRIPHLEAPPSGLPG